MKKKISDSHSLSCFLLFLLFPFLALYSDGSIVGKVINSKSATPLQEVRLTLLDEQTDAILFETLSDAKGAYEFLSVPKGRYRVKADLPEYVAVSPNPLPVRVEDSNARANFSLGIPGGVYGSVKDAESNKVLEGVSVDVMLGTVIVASAQTDDEGNYSIEGLAPRPYIIRVKAASFQTNMQLVIPISDQFVQSNFSLNFPGGKIAGRITNSGTGQPVMDAIVDLFQERTVIDSVQTDENGFYEFMEVVRGDYYIMVRAPKFSPQLEQLSVDMEQDLNFDVAIDPYGIIEGQVINSMTGKPVAGAVIGVWKDDQLLGSTTTQDQGLFVVEGVNGSSILVQALTFKDNETRIEIAPGKKYTVRISLDRQEPTPPKKVAVTVSVDKKGSRTTRTYTVKWRGSADPSVVLYRIYRNGKLAGEVSAKNSFSYKDILKDKLAKRYEVTAVNDVGLESSPMPDQGISN